MYRLFASLLLFNLFSFSVYAQTEISISKKNEKLLGQSYKYYSKKKFDKALNYVEKAMQESEVQDIAMASLLEGNIHFALDNLEEAKTAYLKAIQVSKPTDNAAYTAQIGLARSMTKINRRKEIETKKREREALKDSTDTKKKNKDKTAAFAIIEQVPIYPGCERKLSNAAYKSCMQEKITAHVSENFNTGVSKAIGIKGKININVQFKISAQGDVIDIYAKALNPLLEEEAIRVIQRLPNMQPGTQQGKPVNVIYGLPIIFQLN
ncbi:energy transducer TonB [Nonlabens sp. YIK11]|uniref:energy transducer TonB n=1 Tax=Nonlabens sp. YIK11 TaxID=1453349 RepID=UPI0006DC30F6|nr:energy transducer TonB [Nonlabens sp. YIK11]